MLVVILWSLLRMAWHASATQTLSWCECRPIYFLHAIFASSFWAGKHSLCWRQCLATSRDLQNDEQPSLQKRFHFGLYLIFNWVLYLYLQNFFFIVVCYCCLCHLLQTVFVNLYFILLRVRLFFAPLANNEYTCPQIPCVQALSWQIVQLILDSLNLLWLCTLFFFSFVVTDMLARSCSLE